MDERVLHSCVGRFGTGTVPVSCASRPRSLAAGNSVNGCQAGTVRWEFLEGPSVLPSTVGLSCGQ